MYHSIFYDIPMVTFLQFHLRYLSQTMLMSICFQQGISSMVTAENFKEKNVQVFQKSLKMKMEKKTKVPSDDSYEVHLSND